MKTISHQKSCLMCLKGPMECFDGYKLKSSYSADINTLDNTKRPYSIKYILFTDYPLELMF